MKELLKYTNKGKKYLKNAITLRNVQGVSKSFVFSSLGAKKTCYLFEQPRRNLTSTF